MAIQVGGTTVISNNRALSSVNGLKTINGSSVLGSGDITAGGSDISGGFNTAANGNRNSGQGNTTVLSGSTNGRFFRGNYTGGNGGNPDNTSGGGGLVVNGNDSFFTLGQIDFGFVAAGSNLTTTLSGNHGYVNWSIRYKDA
jgi:hypothetical protein